MIRILCLLLLLTGCSTTSYRILTPYEVSIVPADCFNKKQIVAYLDDQVKYASQNPTAYNENINAIKYKIWEVRTRCSS